MSGLEQILAVPQTFLIGGIAVLDSLPDPVRALLAALLLALFLRIFEVRISAAELQFGQSFRKAALVSLLVIPLLVWLFPASRMVVFVEELPTRGGSDHWAWQLLLAVWAAGTSVSLARVLAHQWRARQQMAGSPTVDDAKLEGRLAHWQQRLGLTRSLRLIWTPQMPCYLASGTAVGLPAAAAHWPAPVQDVLIIHGLCHLQHNHRRWHLFAQLICCAYWPLPWTRRMHGRLLVVFQRACDELARSCYRDRMGFARALRQLEQRAGSPERAAGSGSRRKRSPGARMRRPLQHLTALFEPRPEPPWPPAAQGAEEEAPLQWTDAYDKVVLLVGQAVFFAFLLTGVTLREQPPEIEFEYAMPFELLWKEHFHRNLELLERFQGPSEG